MMKEENLTFECLKDNESSSALYQQFCDWLNSPSTKQYYGERHWNVMKERLELLGGKRWFITGRIKDLESAKRTVSGIHYPEYKEYFEQLEAWAECEIENHACSRWICGFLQNSICQTQLLKYKGDLEKGKSFLLSQYGENLAWNQKKRQNRKPHQITLFDSFDESYNSFQEIWTSLDNKKTLFPICICSNIESYSKLSASLIGDCPDGIKLQRDSIQSRCLVINLTLMSVNRYYYTYRDTHKGHNKYIIYSDQSFKIIKEYLMAVLPDVPFDDTIVGCITMVDRTIRIQKLGITALLSYSKNEYSPSPRVLASFDNRTNCLTARCVPNDVGYRVFTYAAIYHLAQKIGHTISLPLDKTLSHSEYSAFTKKLESKIETLSFDERYLCYLIDIESAFPTFHTYDSNVHSKYRLSRRINLFHNVQHHYSTPVFREWCFPYEKIVYHYENEQFKKNIDFVRKDFYDNRYDRKNIWADKGDKNFLINLRTLCFLNWVSVSYEKNDIKIRSALWLYVILYNCLSSAYPKDKAFFSALLYYELIQNERIYMVVIDNLLTKESNAVYNRYDSASIFYNLIRYYSNSFKGWGNRMSNEQLQFLNGGWEKHKLINLFCQNRVCNTIISDTEVLDLSSKLSTDIAFLHHSTLALFKNMKPFEVPNNLRNNRRTYYTEYNGDYSGTYAHDVAGYSNDEIDTIFDGEPDACWNID